MSNRLWGLYERYLTPKWAHNPPVDQLIEGINTLPDEELWMAHELCRQSLVRRARRLLQSNVRYLSDRSKVKVDKTKNTLSPDILTIGFARRFATYKRGTLLLRNPDRLIALLKDKTRPIQFIFAGKAHPADDEGKKLIQELVQFAENHGVQDRLVFLENYDIGMARSLTQGVDVWLNTPRRPQEASGTSGMKAAINGVINCSILDGWWAEGYNGENGWAIEGNDYYTEDEDRDNYESQQLFNLLENDIIPCFYERSGGDLPQRWIKRMKASIVTGLGEFSSERMVEEYNRFFYEPAAASYRKLTADDAAFAKELVAEKERLVENFDGGKLYIERPAVEGDLADLHVGDKFKVSTRVYLAGLKPEEVEVEAYFGTVNAHNEIITSGAEKMELAETLDDNNYRYSCELTCRVSGRFGLTARIKAAGHEWDNSVPGFMCWPR